MGIFSKKPDIQKMTRESDLNGLIKAMQHDDFSVRYEAIKSLGELFAGFIKFAPDFQPNTYESEKGGYRLALKAILNALNDEEEQIRSMACFHLVFTWGVYERANELASNDLNTQDRKKIADIYKENEEVYKRDMPMENLEALDRGFSRIQFARKGGEQEKGKFAIWLRDRSVAEDREVLSFLIARLGRENSWDEERTKVIIEMALSGLYDIVPDEQGEGCTAVFRP